MTRVITHSLETCTVSYCHLRKRYTFKYIFSVIPTVMYIFLSSVLLVILKCLYQFHRVYFSIGVESVVDFNSHRIVKGNLLAATA